MNAPTLRCYAPELARRLSGADVRYVLQGKGAPPSPLFLIRLGGGGGTLALSLRREFPCIAHLPEGKSPEGMKTAESQGLETILTGLRATGVVVEPVDRSIVIEWPPVTMRLDLVPGRASISLEEGGKRLLRLPAPKKGKGEGRRAAAAGENRSARPDILQFDPEKAGIILSLEDPALARTAIRQSVLSAPPEWINEALHRAEEGDGLGTAWREMTAELRAAEEQAPQPAGATLKPGLYRRGEELILSPIPLRHLEMETPFDRLGDAVEEYWGRRQGELGRDEAIGRLMRTVRPEQKRLARLMKRLEKDTREAEKYPVFRRKGEILSIHFHAIEKGAASVSLPDPYDGGEMEIELDPARSARDNVDRYFKRSAKGERALPHISERLEEARTNADALAEIERKGGLAVTEEEAAQLLVDARACCRPEPKEPEWRKRIKKPSEKKVGARPREYQVAGGYTVLVGRNNKENDFLTFKIAGQRDIWFHVGQSAGSHVVLLKNDPKENPPKEALLAAAALAAHHSKSKHGGRVAVIYTERRFVRKPRGAAPGSVTCTREKTLFVDPGVPEERG